MLFFLSISENRPNIYSSDSSESSDQEDEMRNKKLMKAKKLEDSDEVRERGGEGVEREGEDKLLKGERGEKKWFIRSFFNK